MEAGDCFLSETQTRGSVFVENAKDHPEWMCGNGSMSWDLCIDKKIPVLGSGSPPTTSPAPSLGKNLLTACSTSAEAVRRLAIWR